MPAPAGFTAVAGKASARGKNLFLFEFPPGFDTSIMADVTLDIPVAPKEGIVCRFSHEGKGYVVMELSKHHTANFVSLFPAKGEPYYEPSAAIRRGFRIALEAHPDPIAKKANVVSRVPAYPKAEEIAPPFKPFGFIEVSQSLLPCLALALALPCLALPCLALPCLVLALVLALALALALPCLALPCIASPHTTHSLPLLSGGQHDGGPVSRAQWQ
jgi:hypothetical protein